MPLIIVFNLRLSEEFANTERQNTGLTNMMFETSFVETMVKSLLGANNENENGKIITVFFSVSVSQGAKGTTMLIKIANCKMKPIRHFFLPILI